MKGCLLDCLSGIITTVALAAAFFLPSIAHSSQLTLAWEKPDDRRVAGYHIYCGQSGTAFKLSPYFTVYSKETTSYTFPELEGGLEYSFSATSFDSEGNESDFSETINYFVGSVGDSGSEKPTGHSEYSSNTDSSGAVQDGVINFNENDLNGIPDDTQGFSLETGELEVDEKWLFVAFSTAFVNPVVVAKSISSNGCHPAVIRIKNVDSIGFEIRVQEWDYLDGNHAYETVGYMVMEAGRHILPNGIQVEAGTFELGNIRKTVCFNRAFKQIPVVISGVTTENEMDAVTGRISNITYNTFEIILQEEEIHKNDHKTDETISYIAWEPSSGDVEGMNYIVDSTFNEVTHELYHIPFYPSFMNAPVFVADMQTKDGGETANIRWQNKDGKGIEVQIDEEQSKDSEVRHASEAVGFMAFGNAP